MNKGEPQPKAVLPAAPAHLKGDERVKWDERAKTLHEQGMLTTLDLDALAMYCVVFVRWTKAEQVVREKGEIIKTTNGNIIQNPYLSIANRALEQLNKLGAEFGMTPSSRSRVKLDPMDPEQELERLLFGADVKVRH